LALRRATESSHNNRQNQQLGASRETRGLGVALLGSKEAVAVVQKGRKKEWKAQKSRGFMQANIGIREVAAHPATYLR
jgi:pre-60S factor REI1